MVIIFHGGASRSQTRWNNRLFSAACKMPMKYSVSMTASMSANDVLFHSGFMFIMVKQ